jgi:hypothetical protein
VQSVFEQKDLLDLTRNLDELGCSEGASGVGAMVQKFIAILAAIFTASGVHAESFSADDLHPPHDRTPRGGGF